MMFERTIKQERGPWWRNMDNFGWDDHRSFQKKTIKPGKVPYCYLVDEHRAEGLASLHRSKNIQENCGTGAMWVWDATHQSREVTGAKRSGSYSKTPLPPMSCVPSCQSFLSLCCSLAIWAMRCIDRRLEREKIYPLLSLLVSNGSSCRYHGPWCSSFYQAGPSSDGASSSCGL